MGVRGVEMKMDEEMLRKGENSSGGSGNDQYWEREPKFTPYNSDFVEYYWSQKIVPEGEWQKFMDALARPLPLTFRLCGPETVADCNLEILQRRLMESIDAESLKELQERSLSNLDEFEMEDHEHKVHKASAEYSTAKAFVDNYDKDITKVQAELTELRRSSRETQGKAPQRLIAE